MYVLRIHPSSNPTSIKNKSEPKIDGFFLPTSKAATSTVYFPTLGIASTRTRVWRYGAGFPKALHSPPKMLPEMQYVFKIKDCQVSPSRSTPWIHVEVLGGTY